MEYKADKNTKTLSIEMGHRIARLRQQHHFTQEQLAERAGISHQFFSCVERGEKNIRSENLLKLAIALGVTTDYLLVGMTLDFKEDDKRHVLQQMVKDLDDLNLEHLMWVNEVLNSVLKILKKSNSKQKE